jgi:hypothetical protein
MISKHVRLTALEQAVLATIAYTDQFSYPLSLEEICGRCLFLSTGKAKSQSVKDIESAVLSLIKKKLITKVLDPQEKTVFFVLIGRDSLVKKRRVAEKIAQTKYSEIKQVVDFTNKVPWVTGIYLTGSVAMNTATPESDVDFMIVTEIHRLWLCRLIISLFAQLQGKRRSWNHEEAGSWCFNLWLDTQHLAVDQTKQDTYRAYEVLQAKVLWEREDVAGLFEEKNDWINGFFFLKKKMNQDRKALTTNILSQVFSPAFTLLNFVMWKLQSLYMNRHRTTERVGEGFAFFHPRDTKRVIADGWQKSLERCLPKKQVAEILQIYVGSRTSTNYAK